MCFYENLARVLALVTIIGGHLKSLRLKQNITQQNLVEEAGVSFAVHMNSRR